MSKASKAYTDRQDDAPRDPWLVHAVEIIESTYGDTVSVQQKRKDLLKFGESSQVQTTDTTLMGLPSGTYNETYVSSDLITHFSSASSADTGSMIVEGHTIDGSGNKTFVIQTVTLAGQTKTALTTPLARATKLENDSNTNWVGPIYVYEDDTVTAGVPATASKVHLMAEAGKNNSNKCSTSLSQYDYWIVTHCTADWLEKGVGYAEVHLEVRKNGKVFVEKAHMAVNDGAPHTTYEFKPYLIIPKNADVRLVAAASAAGKYVGGTIYGVLAIII